MRMSASSVLGGVSAAPSSIVGVRVNGTGDPDLPQSVDLPVISESPHLRSVASYFALKNGSSS
jgi:hypothetical protein